MERPINIVRYESNRPLGIRPFFSICIPQYNRTDFLVKGCSTYVSQSFDDFEVCISDDGSTDNREDDLVCYLRNSGLIFTYARQAANLRYDGNLRGAIALSLGRYVLLMGNDDGLSDPDVLHFIRDQIASYRDVAVAMTNFRELSSGRVFRRVRKSGLLGTGPGVAVATFRNYSFVSGLVFDGVSARQEATDICDGTEMYQMYLGTRLIAGGGRLLAIDRVCVDKDLQIAGQVVDSYRSKPMRHIEREILPMGRLLEVVAKGLNSYQSSRERERQLINAALQLYRFTYPFWIIEYRRIRSWRCGLGVFLQFRPPVLAESLTISAMGMVRLWLMYLLMGAASLTIPIKLFDAVRGRLFALAKRFALP